MRFYWHKKLERENETNLSAFSYEKKTHAWISCTHENTRRCSSDSCSSCKRPCSIKCLIYWIKFFIFKFVEIHSLPRNCKLHKAGEFSAVINLKYQASGDLIQIYAKPNGLAYARVGLIVAKKIERHAVKRNRIKRILREVFRKNRHNEHEHLRKMDWVIRLRRPVSKNESIQLATETKLLMFQLQQCHG